MWYLDLSGGVSHTALCEALLKVIEDKKPQFIQLFNGYLERNTELSKQIGAKGELLTNLFLLNKHCSRTLLDRKQVLVLADDMSSLLDTIISLSGEDYLDAFDIVIYLVLLLIMEKFNVKKKMRMFFPRIGTHSPDAVFHILKDSKIILDPLAPAITPMCSAFLVYFKDLFINMIQGTLTTFIKVSDPLDADIRVQLFECTDWNAGSDYNGFEYDIIGVLETNIDDCTPEVISGVMSEILVSGALDYTIVPVIMKKGRSGFYIQVLCQANDMERIAGELLNQTSTFGLRMHTLLRKKLKREIKTIQTTYGKVRIKLGYKGDKIIKAVPEFDDLKTISGTRGISLFSLYNEIMGEIKKGIDCFCIDDKITRL